MKPLEDLDWFHLKELNPQLFDAVSDEMALAMGLEIKERYTTEEGNRMIDIINILEEIDDVDSMREL